ncbi:MAG: DUF4019 domain-containing protein [Candidatus Omnitrophota bacterium]
MIKRNLISFSAILIFIYLTVLPVHAKVSPEIEAQTVEATLLWVTVIDQGLYEQGWLQTSEQFREIVSKEEWIKQLTDVRLPLGEVKSREVYDIGYFGNIPNHPGMEMVVVQFQTSFHNKELAYETISPVRIKGGPWKISGYYIADSVDIKDQ